MRITYAKIYVAALAGAGLFTLAMLAPALAADLPSPFPVKAPVIGYPLGSGLYYGLAAVGDAGSVQGAPVGTTLLKGGGGLVVGYTWPVSGSFMFAEVAGYIENINGGGTGAVNVPGAGPLAGFSLSGPVKFQETVGFGADGLLKTIAGMAPFSGITPAMPSLPVLPAGVTATDQHMYFHVSAEQADVTAQFVTPTIGVLSNHEWTFRAGGGVGLLNRLSNSTVIDVRTTVYASSTEVCVGPFGCPKEGVGVQQALMVKW
jgi:hypothetical protein